MSETKYVVKFTTQFKKDFKLAMKRSFKMDLLEDVITLLAMGELLPDKNKDHALTGNWVGHRECHILPDWLLPDPRIWYETVGRAALEGIVADLSSRGHHSMTVQEDGHIQLSDGSTSVLPELHGFPPVGCWEKLKQVFAGDGLAAEETSGKLVLSW